MAERLEYPPELQGEAEERIRQIHRYLRKIVEQLNNNQSLTDDNLSEYIANQTNALRNITGSSAESSSTDVRDMTAELIKTLTTVLQQLQGAKEGAVTTQTFATEFVKNAKITPVTPAGSSTSFVIANAIKSLQDTMAGDNTKLAKVLDMTGESITGSWHGFFYSGAVDTDEYDNTVYGVAIGQDVVTWSGTTPSYHPENAWAIITINGSVICGDKIATATDLARKANKDAAGTIQTDADLITDSGKYVIEIDSTTQSNFPGSLTDGEWILLEVDGNGLSALLQRIWSEGKIYTRTKASGTWGGWFVFEGIAE